MQYCRGKCFSGLQYWSGRKFLGLQYCSGKMLCSQYYVFPVRSTVVGKGFWVSSSTAVVGKGFWVCSSTVVGKGSPAFST